MDHTVNPDQNQVTTDAESKKKVRAPRTVFQALSIPETIQKLEKLQEENPSGIYSKQDVAAILEISSKGSGLVTFGATVKRYGFWKANGGGNWEITEAGRAVVYHKDSPQYMKACQDAFNHAPFFPEISNKFISGKFGEQNGLLLNYLCGDLKIPKRISSIVAKTYIESRRLLDTFGDTLADTDTDTAVSTSSPKQPVEEVETEIPNSAVLTVSINNQIVTRYVVPCENETQREAAFRKFVRILELELPEERRSV